MDRQIFILHSNEHDSSVTCLKRAQLFFEGMSAHWDEVARGVLLGDNKGGRGGMLRQIRLQCAGSSAFQLDFFLYMRAVDHMHNQFLLAQNYTGARTSRNVTFCLRRSMSLFPAITDAFIISWDELIYPLLISIRVFRYQKPGHNFFSTLQSSNIRPSRFASALKTLMTPPPPPRPVILPIKSLRSESVSYETVRHVVLFIDRLSYRRSERFIQMWFVSFHC
jgi:hypothetical protein